MNALRLLLLTSSLAAAAFVGCEKHDFETTKRLHGGHGGHAEGHGDDHGKNGHGDAHGKDDHGKDDHGKDDHGKGHAKDEKAQGEAHGKQEGETKPAGEARSTGL